MTKNRLQAFADECQDLPQDLFTDESGSGRCMARACASCVQMLCCSRYVLCHCVILRLLQ